MKRTKHDFQKPTGSFIMAENKPFTVLTNDPSLTAWGWAVLNQNGEIISADCIKTAPEHKKRRIRVGDDNIRRISEINQRLREIFKSYNIGLILSELPHGSQNASAAKMIGMVAAICQTISDWEKIPIEWYSEGDAKKAATGRISVPKQAMINRMSMIYPDAPWTRIKYKDEAIADALAIHNVAMEQSAILKFWKAQ